MVKAERDYPYVKGSHGIPFDELIGPFKGKIIGGSGKEILCSIGSDEESAWIRVFDYRETGYEMKADVEGDTMEAVIYTQFRNGTRHPDFFARQFLAFALRRFALQGHEIRRFSAHWIRYGGVRGSKNYEKYMELRKKGELSIYAAKSTWTGKALAELGFTEVEEVDEDTGERVQVYFKRPDQA